MVNEIFNLIPSFIAGLVLGIIFFVGLWWTVKKGISAKQPALLFLGSFFFRIAIVLVGFYFIAEGHSDHLLACFIGFITARYIVTWLADPPVEPQTRPTEELEDAP